MPRHPADPIEPPPPLRQVSTELDSEQNTRQDSHHYGWVFFALSVANGALGYLDSLDHLTTTWDNQAFPFIMGLYLAASITVTLRPRWIEPTFVTTLVATTVYQVGIMYLAIHRPEAVSYYSAASGASFFPLVYVGLFIVSARRATLYSSFHCLSFFALWLFSALVLHDEPSTPQRVQAEHLLYAMLLSHPIYILALRYIVRLRERLHRANQVAYEDKADFLAMLSHEIRNQLQTMVIALDHLDLRLKAPTERKTLGRLQQAATHLQAYLSDVNEYTRLENPTLRISPEPFSPVELLQEVCDEWLPRAQEHGLSLQVVQGEDDALLPTDLILSDRMRLRQVLGNLVSNAIKYTPSGCVTLHAEKKNDQLLLSVRDTGIGIPGDEQARIFLPHIRLRPTEAGDAEGFGLGLAIARKLAQSLGGGISLHSEFGKGTVFVVRLPLEGRSLKA